MDLTFQMGPGLLDVCVLAALAQEDAYGYLLTQKVQQMFPISENSLYPVLRRLLNSGHVQAYNQLYQGRNRKYYTITASGRARLAEIEEEWEVYKQKVDAILKGTAA